MKTYYQGNNKTLLEKAKQYYENNKEILKGQARNRCRELSNEEKNNKKRIWKK